MSTFTCIKNPPVTNWPGFKFTTKGSMYRGDYEGLIIITRCLVRIKPPAGYFINNLKLVKLFLTSEILNTL